MEATEPIVGARRPAFDPAARTRPGRKQEHECRRPRPQRPLAAGSIPGHAADGGASANTDRLPNMIESVTRSMIESVTLNHTSKVSKSVKRDACPRPVTGVGNTGLGGGIAPRTPQGGHGVWRGGGGRRRRREGGGSRGRRAPTTRLLALEKRNFNKSFLREAVLLVHAASLRPTLATDHALTD